MAEGVMYSEGVLLTRNGARVLGTSLSGAVTVPASPVSFTQTYSTAAATVPAATAAAVATTGATNTTPYGYTTAEQADAIVTAVNALIADNLALRKTQNQLIDILQAAGLAT